MQPRNNVGANTPPPVPPPPLVALVANTLKIITGTRKPTIAHLLAML